MGLVVIQEELGLDLENVNPGWLITSPKLRSNTVDVLHLDISPYVDEFFGPFILYGPVHECIKICENLAAVLV